MESNAVEPDVRSISERDLLRWSESLAAIARTGLGFTESLYEQERFEEVLHIAADIRAAADEERTNAIRADDAHARANVAQASDAKSTGSAAQLPGSSDRAGGMGRASKADGWVHEWMGQVGKGIAGYVTPKVAVGAAVGNSEGQLLLIQRADSGIWLYPTGWADVGYSAAEVVVKEVREETGIDVEPLRIIAVLDGFRLGFTRIPLYSLVFQCKPLGGSLEPHPLECLDVGWFGEDELPSPLAAAERWKDHVFKAIRGEPVEVLYDVVRKPVWKGETGNAGRAGAEPIHSAAKPDRTKEK
ncbi:MAG: NUDIX hydrolase N-terminal domain-containing protein [Actinobacteria bacterium]|nr:NUDIX hydrolase N-terminal domain-containing protein [Actinomycetota bacterium]